MSSLRVGGVHFRVHPQDHEPRHVHSYVGDGHVILELRDGGVILADRDDAVRHAKASEVCKVVRVAVEYLDALVTLWEQMNE